MSAAWPVSAEAAVYELRQTAERLLAIADATEFAQSPAPDAQDESAGSLSGGGSIHFHQDREVPLTHEEVKVEFNLAARRLKIRGGLGGRRDENERLDAGITSRHHEQLNGSRLNDSLDSGDETHSGGDVRVDRNAVNCHCCAVQTGSPSVGAVSDTASPTVGAAADSGGSPIGESAAPSGSLA
jgi:hypothetical protein